MNEKIAIEFATHCLDNGYYLGAGNRVVRNIFVFDKKGRETFQQEVIAESVTELFKQYLEENK